MAKTARIKLICLDLGGVVVRIRRSWEEGCRAAGVPVIPSVDPLAVWEAIGHTYQSGKMTTEQFTLQFSEAIDNAYTPEQIRAVYDAWTIDEYEGVCDLICRINDAGFTTAALSNTSDGHWKRLVEMPAIKAFNHLLPSHQLGLVKPDEAIYRAAEARLGCKSGSILFFDDTLPNVEAARAAGWHAEQIDHAGCPAAQMRSALQNYHIEL